MNKSLEIIEKLILSYQDHADLTQDLKTLKTEICLLLGAETTYEEMPKLQQDILKSVRFFSTDEDEISQRTNQPIEKISEALNALFRAGLIAKHPELDEKFGLSEKGITFMGQVALPEVNS